MQSRNLYAYAVNDPLMYTDPSGEAIPLAIPAWYATYTAFVAAGKFLLSTFAAGAAIAAPATGATSRQKSNATTRTCGDMEGLFHTARSARSLKQMAAASVAVGVLVQQQ